MRGVATLEEKAGDMSENEGFRTLSLRDVLAARDAYHAHLINQARSDGAAAAVPSRRDSRPDVRYQYAAE